MVEFVDKLDDIESQSEAFKIANTFGNAANARVSLILNNGVVIGDSYVEDDKIALLDNHGSREEVIKALESGSGWSSRYSNSVNQQQLYFAITDNNVEKPNIIRVAVPYI